MKRIERVPRAGVGVVLVLAFATVLALLVRSETRLRSGGMPLAVAILVALLGVAIGAWLLCMAVGGGASNPTGSNESVRWSAQKSWWVGLGWAALFLPLARAIRMPVLWYIAFVPLAFLVATLIHECGHVAAALALGIRITAVQLGPFRLDLKTGRLAPARAPDLGGGVWALDASRSRLCSVVFASAGPLANLAFAIVCFVASRNLLSFVFGWASAMAVIVSLLPFPVEQGGMKTDGKALLDIFFRWPSMAAERQILAEVLLGRRPREWSLSLGECLARAHEPGTLLALLAFARAMDEHQMEVGARILEDALSIHELAPKVRSD